MPNRSSKHKRPRDLNQLARLIAGIATGDIQDVKTEDGKNPAAVALGRKGGLKGGKVRAARMTGKQRQESARKAAKARWQKASRSSD